MTKKCVRCECGHVETKDIVDLGYKEEIEGLESAYFGFCTKCARPSISVNGDININQTHKVQALHDLVGELLGEVQRAITEKGEA